MNLSKLRGWRPNYLAVAFLMPFVGMLVLMMCCIPICGISIFLSSRRIATHF